MKKYIEHVAGFSLLLDWHARWHAISSEVLVENSGFSLGSWVTQRFLIGAPRRARYGSGLFIGIQDSEAAWFSRLKWSRCVIQADGQPHARLSFVASRQAGDGADVTDIPAFSVSLPVLDRNLASVLASFRYMEGRGVWEDEGKLEVAAGNPLFRMPLVSQGFDVPLLNESEAFGGRTMDDVINERMMRTNRELPSAAKV